MADDGHLGDRQKVLIAGAGVGGLEAALALSDLAPGRVEVELCDSREEFVYRPFAVGEAYGAVRAFHYDLRRLCEHCGGNLRPGTIVSVDPKRRLATNSEGEQLSYEHLIVATGAHMRSAVPGAVTFWGADEGPMREVTEKLRAGRLRRLVFTMAAGCSWVLPLYELALIAVTEVERIGARTQVTVVTPEEMPLEAFGRRVAEQTAALLRSRAVELVAGAEPVQFEDGRLGVAAGSDLDADAVVSLPRFEGRRIGGIPCDADGFVSVDEHGGVIGLERVYAVGDVTTFPLKQGALTTQQADAVGEAIAAAVVGGFEPRSFDPLLRGVLWTGRRPRYLYGRPNGAHDEASSFSERPQGPLRTGKVSARYLSPLVDRLTAEDDFAATVAGGPSAS